MIFSILSGVTPFRSMAARSFTLTLFIRSSERSKLFRFVTGKIGYHHCDLEHLFLKKRNAERAFQHRLQAIIEIRHGLFLSAARQIWMDHVALDRARPDDRD